MKFSDFKLLIGRKNKAAGNKRLGNRLAEGIIISNKSISAIVPADQYKLAFCLYNFSISIGFASGRAFVIFGCSSLSAVVPAHGILLSSWFLFRQ